MALYSFKGVNKKGQNVHGNIEADSLSSARTLIKKNNIYLTSIQDNSKKKITPFLFNTKKVDVKALSIMTLNLSTLLKSGVPLVDALDTISKQTTHTAMAEAVSYIKNSVNEGRSFHKSLSAFPSIFNKTFISMCEAGELSGTLDIVLARLAQFTTAQSQLQNKVRSAMVYPALMTVFSFFMIIFLLVYVVPKVRVLFEENEAASIPWYSMLLLDMSDFLVQYWMSAGLLFLGAVFVFWRWKKSPHGKKTWDITSLKLPVFGNLIRSVAISRMSRTLSTLLKGGVPVPEALNIVKDVVNNQKISAVIALSKDSIEKGDSLSAPLIRSGEFPPMVTQMIRVGEKTGQLEKMLSQISDTYDAQVKSDIEAMTALLEPLMLIIMGGIIAFIVFSTLIPLLQMYNLSGLGA